MNNIKQKNVIYGMKPSSDLPYKQVEYINHNECCETLNEVDINNLANQLVDNDVYVEQYLNHTSSYVVGPKAYDEATVESMPNGYKAFGNLKGADCLQILHKVETPISQTVSRLQAGEVKVLKKFGDLVIANIQGSARCTYDPINGPWEALFWCVGSQCYTVNANDVYASDSGCFVAADNGIFQLSSGSEYDSSSGQVVERHSLVKLDSDSSFPHATSIAVDEKSSKIYVGCNQSSTKMLVGDYTPSLGVGNAGHVNLKPVSLYSDHQPVTNDLINDIEVLKDSNEAIAAGNTSLYFKSVQNYLQDKVVLTPSSEAPSFTASIQYNNRIFFGSSTGLWYKTQDGSLSKVASISNAVLKLVQGNGKLYVATESKIYSVLPDFTVRQEPFSNYGTISSIEVIGPCVVVATSRGLWSYDASTAGSYIFKMKDPSEAPGIKDLKYSSGYLAMAGDTALSVMAISASSSAEEFPIIDSLEEFPVAGIDGSSGNSGFLKFISVLGHKLAVFQSKIQCLDQANASYTPPSTLLNAISLGAKDGVGYLAVTTSNSTEFLGFDGVAFDTRRSFSEIAGADNLACVDDLVVASNSSQTVLSSWRMGDYDFLNSDPWTTRAATASFTDIKTCGLCAICQVGSSGLSAFSKTSIAEKIPSDSPIGGYSSLDDACAVDWLSTQFLAAGDGSTPAQAFILSSYEKNEDDDFVAGFSGPISISTTRAKRVEVIQDPDNSEAYYAYVLNIGGALYCYDLTKSLDGEGKLTSYQVDSAFNTGTQYSDLQTVSKCGVDGALLTKGNTTYTHFPSLGEPRLAAGSGNATYAVPVIDEDPSGSIHKLIYSIGPNVQISSLADGHVETTPLANLAGDVKKIQLGFNGLYAQHGQTVAMTYTDSSDVEHAYDMRFDNGDGTYSPALVTDFVVCGISKDYGGEEPAERDLLIAAIGDQLHIVDLNGDSPRDFSSSTVVAGLGLDGETIASIGSIQLINDDEDTSTSFIAAGTQNQIVVFKVYGVPGSSPSQPSQVTVEPPVWRKSDLGYNVKKLAFDKHDHLVCLDTTSPASRAHVFPVKIFASEIIVEDQSQTVSGVKDVFQEYREDGELASTWLYVGNALTTIDTMRQVSVAAGFTCTSVGASLNGMVALGSSSGLYTSEREMSASNIKADFTGSQQLNSASYASGLVFICGASGGLSCYPLSDPSTASLTCLNDSTEFTRCHASEYDGMVNLVAWTEDEIYSQSYASADDVDAYSFGAEAASKKFQNTSIQYVMAKDDQLMMPPLQGEEEGGGEPMPDINLFACLAAIQDTSYSNYFLGASDGIYCDNGHYGLFQYPPDSTTRVLKFIQRDEYDGKLAYITSSGDEVKLYPSGQRVFSGSSLTNAILDDGIWYYQSGTSLKYMPFGEDGESLAFPKYGTQTISQLAGITLVDGRKFYGTEYGILRASFVKQQVVGEDASVKALYQNFSWSGKNFKTLNQSGVYGMVVVAKPATGAAAAFKTDIRSSNTSEELKFYAPEGDGDQSTPVDLDDIWCVNEDLIAGMFCQPRQSGSHECESWLNAIVGSKLSPYTNVDESGINAVSRHTDGYYLLCDDRVVSFTNYGEILVFERVPNSGTSLNGYSHLSKISESKLLAVGNGGLATYSNGQVGMIKVKDGIDAVASYVVDGHQSYLHNVGTSILSSTNYKMWKPLLDLPGSAATVIDATCLNSRTYLFATTNGLYGTKYSFEMVNDVLPMTKDRALSVYNQLVATSLSSQLSATLSAHLSTDHLSSSMITRLNEDYATVQLDDVMSSWQQVEVSSLGAAELGVKNDIIAEMTFGTGMDGDVVAQISNFLNPEDDWTMEEISSMTYITKRWMSGVTELFINIPTTRTYYLNNLYGASDCKLLPGNSSSRKNLEDFGVDKLEQTGVLSDHYTLLQIGLASAEYSVDKLVDVQINGMSLPLKIYREKPTTGAGKLQDNLYRSFIEPSVGKGYNIETTDAEGNWIFNFACFGTDAQAVHLMFYDEKARSSGATVRVVFDPNGGDGVMSPQKFVLKDDGTGCLVPEQKPLKRCKFTNTSAGYEKIFAGWSIAPLPDNESPKYEDNQVFPNSTNWIDLANELELEVSDVLKHKDEIKLYAVWLTYQFSENDTTLVFNSNKTEFAIDDVGIDESTNLKDKVVIDWGD